MYFVLYYLDFFFIYISVRVDVYSCKVRFTDYLVHAFFLVILISSELTVLTPSTGGSTGSHHKYAYTLWEV